MAEQVKAEQKPWRVSHPNGDCVAGFDIERDATDDAKERNVRAEIQSLGIRYTAGPRSA